MITISGLDNTSFTVRKASGAVTLTDNDSIVLCTPTASFTVTIPAADPTQPGQVFYIAQTAVSGNFVTIAPASGQIDGASTLALTANTKQQVKIVSDGTNWFSF